MQHQTASSLSGAAGAPAAAVSSRRCPLLVLYLLDAFALGGCVALLAVRQVVLGIMARIQAAAAAGQLDSARAGSAGGDYLNLLDHLLTYDLAFGAAFLVFMLFTLTAWLVQALRR